MIKESVILSDIQDLKGRYISFDTETTGLSTTTDHLISIAGVEIIDGRLTGRQFEGFISPRNPICESATKVHKLDSNFYTNYYSNTYQSDENVIRNFAEFVGDSPLIAYNASFDQGFLYKELSNFKIKALLQNKFVCAMRLFKNIFSSIDSSIKKGVTLESCCKYLGVYSPSNQNFHSALYDAFMCARITCKMMEFKLSRQIVRKKSKVNVNNNKAQKTDHSSVDSTSRQTAELNNKNALSEEELNNLIDEVEYTTCSYYVQELKLLGKKINKDREKINREEKPILVIHAPATNTNIISLNEQNITKPSNNPESYENDKNVEPIDNEHLKSMLEDLATYMKGNPEPKDTVNDKNLEIRPEDLQWILNDY